MGIFTKMPLPPPMENVKRGSDALHANAKSRADAVSGCIGQIGHGESS